jgi:ABC-type multidrug transport system ATPase subunit
LIVDEPTVGLDPHSVRRLKDLLRRQADRGTTVFLSSHSLDVVQELADRIAIIERGRLIACGSLKALRAQAAVDGSLEEVFLTLTRYDEAGNGKPPTPDLPSPNLGEAERHPPPQPSPTRGEGEDKPSPAGLPAHTERGEGRVGGAVHPPRAN